VVLYRLDTVRQRLYIDRPVAFGIATGVIAHPWLFVSQKLAILAIVCSNLFDYFDGDRLMTVCAVSFEEMFQAERFFVHICVCCWYMVCNEIAAGTYRSVLG
jgi:hypothetical protein